MKKHLLLTLLASVLFAFNAQAQFDPNVFYNLSPQYQPTKSLDVINDGKNFNKVWLDKTQKVTGQAWKITPVAGQAGFYRLSPQYQPTKSLDVINDGKNFNQVWLDKTQNVTGQYWKITPVAGQAGFYNLTPMYQPTKSLDVINDGKNFNQLQLAKTGAFTGQQWKITSLAPPANPTTGTQTGENNAKGQVLQLTKANLYNVKGTKIEIAVSANGYTQVLYAMPTGELQFQDRKIAGTWMQNGTGAENTSFVLAFGKNEVVNRNVNLDTWVGTYNSTGKGTAIRYSASAQMGANGVVTITVIP